MWYIAQWNLLDYEKEWSINTCYNMDELETIF